MTPSAALDACFGSASPLWPAFLARFGRTPQRMAWYPSAGVDLRPMLNWKRESFRLMNLDLDAIGYEEPDLFIFSDYASSDPARHGWKFGDRRPARLPSQQLTFDYLPEHPSSRQIDLHADNRTSIVTRRFCEITSNPASYQYELLQQYLHFKPSKFTGRAFFFEASINSDRLGNYDRDAIYFAYNNVKLLQQLFLRHEVPLSHLFWHRDGSGLGGGLLRHDFLVPVSTLLRTRWYLISECYHQLLQRGESAEWPEELREIKALCPVSVPLNRIATFQWNVQDRTAFLQRGSS
jgi:hypothetical protein